MNQHELSKPTANLDRAWAILFARLVLGLIFFMAGVMKVFALLLPREDDRFSLDYFLVKKTTAH